MRSTREDLRFSSSLSGKATGTTRGTTDCTEGAETPDETVPFEPETVDVVEEPAEETEDDAVLGVVMPTVPTEGPELLPVFVLEDE
jgi:hypothetical protein